jgi:hypothetical protein
MTFDHLVLWSRRLGWICSLVAPLLTAVPASAGEVDVVGVKVTKAGGDVYRFDVTLRHADEGWEHYADRWEVVSLDGGKLGQRVLAHPHVDEQPFTRSASITIPAGTTEVIVRGHDLVHGYGGTEMRVSLPH